MNNRFGHREHLHVAWTAVHAYGPEGAGDHVVSFIKDVAAAHGGTQLYNETMTRFWVWAVATAIETAEHGADFDALLEEHPQLTDKRLPWRHWSDELLRSADAKARWVDPDLRPLPGRRS
jgi:hypothetical protein